MHLSSTVTEEVEVDPDPFTNGVTLAGYLEAVSDEVSLSAVALS